MTNRRKFFTMLTTGFVALAVIVGSTLADELMGYITKVDADAKKVTVVDKDDKETEVTVTDDTEWVTRKATTKINLARVAKDLEKAKEKGNKGINVTVTHEKGTASKIAPVPKKKAAN